MMRHQALHVSMETLLAASPLMGHQLEDREAIRSAQDLALADFLLVHTATRLRSRTQRELFCVAPLDILVSERDGRKEFHLLELNGTGIGGISNLPGATVETILGTLAECTSAVAEPGGVVLLAVSGKESNTSPRLNRLMHEKLLFLEAMRKGVSRRFGGCDVRNVEQLAAEAERAGPGGVANQRPAVVIGYMKDFLHNLRLDDAGGLWLHGRRVSGAVNDRFCRNVLSQFHDAVDLNAWQSINRCFAAGADKGVAYALMNEFIEHTRHPGLPRQVLSAHAHSRDELIETVKTWLRANRQVVIKPHATGLGHGIEFFMDQGESESSIVERIDRSLQQTEEFYALPGGALPYTVCEYVDASRVSAADHPLYGHKYELRVVVYRDGMHLRAFPSIAKIARERCDAAGANVPRRALINNITASGDTDKVCGADYMLPLCNRRSLAMLNLSARDMHELCSIATGYVSHVLNEVEDRPERFGLPRSAVREPVRSAVQRLQLAAA